MHSRFGLILAGLLLSSAAVHAAEPVAGLPNFHKVNDMLYRGAQPTGEGFRSLAGMGIRTVIDLRGPEHSEADEKRVVEAAGMRYVSIPMKGMQTPSDDQIAAALKVMNDATAGPVFVHCRRGADRTGTVVACYRIGHDRWDGGKAIAEAKADGMSVFQVAMRRYVERYYVEQYGGQAPSLGIPAFMMPSPAR